MLKVVVPPGKESPRRYNAGMSLVGQRRLVHQRVVAADFATAAEVVAHLGGLQGQDYAGVKWSIGARMAKATEREVEGAFERGEVLRTWPMRGTLHVVAAADIRWILDLLAPRILRKIAGRCRELQLDAETFAKSEAVMVRALEETPILTRDELAEALRKDGIDPEGQRMAYMLMRAGVEKVLCFGPRRGKEFTYVLLDRFSPSQAKPKERDEALRELTLRYFRSRGPATAADFACWSGLSLTEAKTGLKGLDGALVETEIEGQTYWGPPGEVAEGKGVFAIPGFDEFILGYQDRDAVLDPAFANRVVPGGNGVFHPIIVVDGRVVGTWRRTLKKATVEIVASPFSPLSKREEKGLERAIRRYADYLELEPTISEWSVE